MTDRANVKIILLAVLLAIVVLGSYNFMAAKKRSAKYAQLDAQKCSEMVSEILSLKQKPKLASDHERLASETTGLIETAAKSAGIRPASIVRITPQPPRRIPDSDYKEKPTSVALKNITLQQLVTMARNLRDNESNLNLKSINLSAPKSQDTGPQWNVDLVLIYLIYDQLQTVK